MNKILIKSGLPEDPCITPLPWVDNAPDFSGITEPTLSVLVAAYEAQKGSIVIIPDPEPEPIIQVREIDARRLRLALWQLGYLSTVTAAVSSLGEAAIIDWEYATIIKEDYPLVAALATNLGLDTEAIFTLAISLP